MFDYLVHKVVVLELESVFGVVVEGSNQIGGVEVVDVAVDKVDDLLGQFGAIEQLLFADDLEHLQKT